MRAILPPWTDPDPLLHARLGEVIDPERKVLAALERIVPLSGKRIADVGTGIGHYPMLLARRTGRTYGIESEPALLEVAVVVNLAVLSIHRYQKQQYGNELGHLAFFALDEVPADLSED